MVEAVGLGVWLDAWSTIFPGVGVGQGGSARGPYMSAGGAVGSQDFSPEAAVWATSGTTIGRRTPEQAGVLQVPGQNGEGPK